MMHNHTNGHHRHATVFLRVLLIMVALTAIFAAGESFSLPPVDKESGQGVPEQEINYHELIEVSGAVLILLALFFYWNRRLAREIAVRRQSEHELKIFQEQLEETIRQRTAEIETKNLALTEEIRERQKAQELLQQSHALLKSLSEQVPGVLFQTDVSSDGQFCTPYASEKLYDIYELSPGQIKQDLTLLFSRFHPEDHARIVASIEQSIANLTRWECEYRVLLPRQGLKWLYGTAQPQQRDDGSIVMYGIIMDITEREFMQKELLKMQKLESLGVLAGGIAHDFNNILTGIVGNISFALSFLDPSHRSFKILQDTEKATQRATDLAHQLLTFAKGGQPIKKIVSLRQIVEASASLTLRGSNVASKIQIPKALHLIEADEGQINQAFNNIIINAAQAMPNGGSITITAENTTLEKFNVMSLPPGDYVKLRFIDTGCGISEEVQSSIFDPYFTTKTEGNGLGLSSTYSIIIKHGGHITVHSQPGNGTTFVVLLPATAGHERPEAENGAPSIAAGEQSGISLLFMDDDDIIRELATEMLGDLGYQVQNCVNGSEAIAFYQDAKRSGNPYAIVIMDLTIPGGMGGKEAARHILAIDPEARLIVSSGYSNDPIMSDYETYGFCAALVKPYSLPQIARVLARVLQTV